MTTLTTEELDARVSRGAALLDEKDPGWLAVINTDLLDLHSTEHCIGGQLAPEGTDPNQAYSDTMVRLGLDREEAIDYGFQLGMWEVHEYAEEFGPDATGTQIYAPLTDAWKRLITARLETSA